MNFRFTKLFSLILALALLVGVAPALGVAAEAVEITPVNIPMYGRSALATMDNSSALLYAYDQLAAGIENAEESITVYNGTDLISMDEIQVVMDAYRRDYTYHFWLGTSYSVSSYASIDTVVRVIPTYLLTGEALETAKEQFNNAAEEILSGITPGMSDYEKELYLHDKLAEKITYTMGTIHAHDAYGALVEGQSVCEGYAESLQYLLQRCGIQSFIIEGGGFNPATGTYEAHAWNAVKIDGQFAHVDLTWNDQGEDTYHAYFNVTDSMIQQDHVIDVPVYPLPACTSDSNFYFKQTGGYLDSYTVEQMGKLLKDTKGEAHVYIPGDMQTFLNWYAANIRDIAKAAGVTGSFSYGYSYLGREMILTIPQLQVEEPEHTHSYEAEVTDPTCTEVGCTTYTCDCGDSYAEEIPALGHKQVAEKGWAATCTGYGMTDRIYCSRCDEVLQEKEQISALGHNYESVKTPGTCADYGYVTNTCTRCGDSSVTKDNNVWSEWSEVYPENVLEGLIDTAVQYRYRDKEILETTEESVEGWTLIGPAQVPGEFGPWSEWSDYSITATDTVQVDTRTMYAYMYYECPYCGMHWPGGGTCWKDNGGCGMNRYYQGNVLLWSTVSYEDATWYDWFDTGNGYTYIDDQLCFKHRWNYGENSGSTKTQYRSRKIQMLDGYSFYRWTDWSDWSLEAVEASETREVETRTVYRYADVSAMEHTPNIPAPTENEDQVCTVCGIVLGEKTGHVCKNNLTYVSPKDPTCTEFGAMAHYACSCGKTYEDADATVMLNGVIINVLGHEENTVAGYAAACTTDGKTDGKTCTRCGQVLTEQETIPAPGHVEEILPKLEPTCTSAGRTEGKECSVCGEILTAQETIAALGHTEVVDEAVDATCKAIGLTEGTHCATCNTVLVAQTIVDKMPHTEEIIPAVDATCTTTGLTEGKKCAVCGETLTAQEEIPALDHTEETIPGVDPTCTTDGKTEGKKCSACGTTLLAQKVITALGHTPEVIPGYGATCTEPGLTDGEKCGTCAAVTKEQTAIPAVGHAWDNGICENCGKECEHSYEEEGGSCTICGGSCAHDYETTVTKPGCTAQGYTTYTCTICGNSYNGDYVDALGHDWKAATCTASKTCAVCGITEGIANGHNYASVVTAPTCTAQGYTTHTCASCGHSYTDSETQALGHVSGTPVEENRVEAGCTAEGSFDTVVYCTACNAELSREKHATPAVGHSYGDWTIATDATCTADGEQRRVCENCDQHESEAIPALGHDWNGDTCDRCGESNSPYKVELTLADNSIDSVWVDGKEYPVTKIAGGIRVELADENATNLVIYTYNDPDASDIHAQYPIGMRVWLLSYADGYTATYVPEFDNLLRYSGSSIRVTGKKGIRMITSIDKDLRTSLMNEGLAGYTLVEYGTAVSWTANGTPILGKDSTMSNYAYRKGVADPIFQDTGDLIQYTNVLVGFSDAQCAADLAMRPYIILENAEGEQITLYGGQVTRSIGYIAYQNRNVFEEGTAAYDYVWEIIHHVYGDKFD